MGDKGSIPGSGRRPGGGKGNSLQYSCLYTSIYRVAWQSTVHGVTKSWTQLSNSRTYVESKIWHKCIYLWSRNRLTDVENRRQRGMGGGWVDWEFGSNRCKLLYIKWINTKILLYRTVSCIQYPVINHNGKECIHMWNWIT